MSTSFALDNNIFHWKQFCSALMQAGQPLKPPKDVSKVKISKIEPILKNIKDKNIKLEGMSSMLDDVLKQQTFIHEFIYVTNENRKYEIGNLREEVAFLRNYIFELSLLLH